MVKGFIGRKELEKKNSRFQSLHTHASWVFSAQPTALIYIFFFLNNL